MQPDQQLISQLDEAVGSARRTLDETKRRRKARISALRAEQRQEIEGFKLWSEGTGGRLLRKGGNESRLFRDLKCFPPLREGRSGVRPTCLRVCRR